MNKSVSICTQSENLTLNDLSPRYVIFDLVNITRSPCCIYDPNLVATGLQFLKETQITENLTKMKHNRFVSRDFAFFVFERT